MSLTPTPYRRELVDLCDSGLLNEPDVVCAFFGGLLGEGVSRRVYKCKWDEEQVIKLAIPSRPDFQNQAEYSLWCAADDALRHWLAPTHYISPLGLVLFQTYCEPCPSHMIPKKVPKVLADCHDGNWGIYEGRPVLHDYGRTMAFKMANNDRAMRLVLREDSYEYS